MTFTTGVAMLAADTPRARAYLDLLRTSKLLPEKVIIVDTVSVPASLSSDQTDLFDNLTPLKDALARAGVPYLNIQAPDINDEIVVEAVSELEQDILIFAGPAGAIVRSGLFATGKQFVHVHPGKLPQYRGSTPMYYSLLKGEPLTASAIFLSSELDAGAVLGERSFDLPCSLETIDYAYDPWMRATLLVDIIKKYVDQKGLNPVVLGIEKSTVWHVIHPVLKTLAILSQD